MDGKFPQNIFKIQWVKYCHMALNFSSGLKPWNAAYNFRFMAKTVHLTEMGYTYEKLTNMIQGFKDSKRINRSSNTLSYNPTWCLGDLENFNF